MRGLKNIILLHIYLSIFSFYCIAIEINIEDLVSGTYQVECKNNNQCIVRLFDFKTKHFVSVPGMVKRKNNGNYSGIIKTTHNTIIAMKIDKETEYFRTNSEGTIITDQEGGFALQEALKIFRRPVVKYKSPNSSDSSAKSVDSFSSALHSVPSSLSTHSNSTAGSGSKINNSYAIEAKKVQKALDHFMLWVKQNGFDVEQVNQVYKEIGLGFIESELDKYNTPNSSSASEQIKVTERNSTAAKLELFRTFKLSPFRMAKIIKDIAKKSNVTIKNPRTLRNCGSELVDALNDFNKFLSPKGFSLLDATLEAGTPHNLGQQTDDSKFCQKIQAGSKTFIQPIESEKVLGSCQNTRNTKLVQPIGPPKETSTGTNKNAGTAN